MLLTNVTKWSVLCYALLLIILGALGFYFAGSQFSLIYGASSGFVLLLSAIAMFRNSKKGAWFALFITLILTVLFSYRYSLTHTLIPALLAVISAIVLIILLARIAQKTKR